MAFFFNQNNICFYTKKQIYPHYSQFVPHSPLIKLAWISNKSIKKYGPIAGLVRISDKFNRLENLLMGNDAKVKDERVEDTLLDLANYCIMLKMAI